jgi:hypothetical protein
MSSDSLVGMRESIVRAMETFVEVESEEAVEVRWYSFQKTNRTKNPSFLPPFFPPFFSFSPPPVPASSPITIILYYIHYNYIWSPLSLSSLSSLFFFKYFFRPSRVGLGNQVMQAMRDGILQAVEPYVEVECTEAVEVKSDFSLF